jgi:quercetin dioxygenase-like cupin family protein
MADGGGRAVPISDDEATIQRRGDTWSEHNLYNGAGEVGMETYFPHLSRLNATVMRYSLAPGASEGMHHHDETPDSCSPFSSEELYLVTVGELVVTIDGVSTLLRAGDAAYCPAGSHHGVVNASNEPAEAVLIFGAPRVEPLVAEIVAAQVTV